MKLPILTVVLLCSTLAQAQTPEHVRVVSDDAFLDLPLPQQQERIAANIEHGVSELRLQGRLPQDSAQALVMDLAWPLQPVGRFDQFGYHGVSNFVDHGPPYPGPAQDYTCGTRTYNLSNGYNHAGTDYYLWPFPWSMMDAGQVQIVAAAPGVIMVKDDGNFDRDCALDDVTNPNDVYVMQDDGLVAIYLHMRKGSVTSLPIGARVAAGDYLGLVGSSGSSTGPHMHFELRDANSAVVDPRNGQCNAAPDRWIVFQPYEDPHIDTLSMHSAEPEFVACGVDTNGNAVAESPHYKNDFMPGDTLWVFASYRDQRNGEVTQFSIKRPDGSVFAQWDFDLASQGNPKPFYSGTGADWKFTLPADAPIGVWTTTAVFQGQTYSRRFTVDWGWVPLRTRLPPEPPRPPRP
jgi:murein DD-endopeptidase MepM/ murein hydrolase activator NlpD